MCSIFGIIGINHTLANRHVQEAEHLMVSMRHRGPDAEDMRQCSGNAILGSNRLRVTDAQNDHADMPMVSARTGNTVVFNGEIYNHELIKSQLTEHDFQTNSDTEVILAAYDQWGSDCLQKFNGMFAIAIHDKSADKIFLACDPTGQKSIYLHQDKDTVLFASEIAALISNPQRNKSWDTKSLSEFIAHRFIIGEDSHIKEIKKLLPGTSAQISKQGITKQRFYQIPIGDQTNQNQFVAKQKIKYAIEAGCRRSFNLEVPYALLLSGGIDSTAVLALAVQASLKPSTYSIGFINDHASGPQKLLGQDTQSSTSIYDEFEYSDKMAQDYGTQHTKTILSASDYCDYLDKWAEYSGEPLGSQEGPCLVKLFESIQSTTKVAFTGSGPDEIFDGYSYGKIMQDKGVQLENLGQAYAKNFTWSGSVDLEKLMPQVNVENNLTAKYNDILKIYDGQVDNVLQATQLLHFHGRLAAYEFRQIDVISMRHSIEARSPLIDLAVVESAFDFSPELKQLGGSEKGIYKDSLRTIVPDIIIDRQKKGFPIPSEIWFSQDFEKRAAILFDDKSMIKKLKLVDINYLTELWQSKAPDDRNIFSRLYTLERVLRQQSDFVSMPLIAMPQNSSFEQQRYIA